MRKGTSNLKQMFNKVGRRNLRLPTALAYHFQHNGFVYLVFPNFGKLETFQIYFPIFGKIFFQFLNFWKIDFPKIGKQIGNFPIFQILEKADE